jgi:hypothetical protein
VRSSKGLCAVVLGLIALTLIPRLIGIDLFATIDEPYWLTAGSDFYYALQRGRNSPPKVTRALEEATPEKTIGLNGIEYIRI